MPPVVWKTYTTNKQAGHRLSIRDVESAPLDAVASLGKDVYIILDALDEIPTTAQMKNRGEILGFLERLARLTS